MHNNPWERLYPSGVSDSFLSNVHSMIEAWDNQVFARPDATAIYYFGASRTFREIDDTANALASGFVAAGVIAGDRVAVFLQNDPQWLIAAVAAWKIGAAPVAVNPMLHAEELVSLLRDADARVLVSLDSLFDHLPEGVFADLALELIVTTHPLDVMPEAVIPVALRDAVGPKQTFEGTTDWASVIAANQEVGGIDRLSTENLAALCYTSGTTGVPKGAMCTHSGMSYGSDAYTRWWDLGPDDVIIGLAPLCHITGLVACLGVHIMSGAPLVLMHRFDAEECLKAIEQHRGTFMVASSTAYIALSDQAEAMDLDLSSMTKTLSGGAPVGEALVARVAAKTGWRMHGVYGMTETNSPTHLAPIATDPPVDVDSGSLAVGVPIPGAQIRLIDATTGEDCPAGSAGEIVIKGPMVIPGYWRRPEETTHAIRDGWLHTGDIGKMDENGWLFVVDRLKDLINAGGFKIWPREVEDVLYRHPAIREAAVVGVADDYRGETVKAVVSLYANSSVTPEEISEFCRSQMAAYKYPRIVEIVDELPKTSSGKILKRSLVSPS